MAGVMFNDTFVLTEVDMVPDGKDSTRRVKDKKFDKVSRIEAHSVSYTTEMVLDVNTEIYPMVPGDNFELMLASTLQEEGDDDDAAGGAEGGGGAGTYGYDSSKPLGSRVDAYEYVMGGKVFKYSEDKGVVFVYTSFGGLLMQLSGEPKVLPAQSFAVDKRVYLFVRKVAAA